MSSELNTIFVIVQKTMRRGLSSDAKELWKKFLNYVEEVKNHPALKQRHVHFKGEILPYYEERFRPLLQKEMLRNIGVPRSTWHHWKTQREDLKQIIEDIEGIIHDQKLLAGYSDLSNTTITAQDLGLSTKLDVETKDVGLEEFLQNRVNDDVNQAAYEKRRGRRKSGEKVGD